MNRWETIFKTLANVNRLKIIKMLPSGEKLNVGDISQKLRITFSATSRHLIILQRVGVLETEGTAGHVFYFIRQDIPNDFRKVLSVFIKH